MEGIHGVDVSWLHHTAKDHSSKFNSSSSPAADETVLPNKQTSQSKDEPTAPKANGFHSTPSPIHVHRPQILNRANSEKTESGLGSSKNQKDPKASPIGRRNSWMSSISSKFSSSSTPASSTGSPSPPVSKSPSNNSQPELSNPFGAAVTPTARDAKQTDAPPSSPPASGKGGHTFIQSALRRLGSSGGGSTAKAAGCSGVCPRKTMNVDPYRERCSLPDLDLRNLRRVAFCVDVEIAGAAQYTEEEPQEPPPVPSLTAESSLNKMEHEMQAKRRKDQKQKKGEGAALKNQTTVTEAKEKDEAVKATGEHMKPAPPDKSQESTAPQDSEVKEPTKKKEKRKRSESERKERKERKHQEALANGSIPIEVRGEGSSGSANDTPSGADTPPKSQDRPTIDPLRIYRRCCQLRETPILKRIVEQISSPSACHVMTPGILSNLDLSGYWMQLPDLITLGDYLAVVPVKRLVLENCGLGDEAIRVILAGLLAAKTPEQAKYNKKLAKKINGETTEVTEQLGVIEKLILKDNPKIGKEGWRHIALFIYMSRSLKGIDVSMIPFPKSSAIADSVKHHHHTPLHHTSPPPSPIDISTVVQEAIGERLAGNRLEELIMAECGLSTECIGKVVDGVTKCGSTRLGLAGNNITQEGLGHVIRYLRSGKCEGLDLGGNDLREDLHMLAEALDEKSTMWALSLADCNLAPLSLESLFPALVQLPNLRFIDLSHNRDLFLTRPTGLGLIRKYIPQLSMIRRIHLMDVAMTPEHAIALAEILPESQNLAHLNIMENHLLSPLASAKTEAMQEEACAFYASLMAAVRVSDTIICIDVDVPSQDSSEIVKALAKQVVAYSLRNLERLPLAETSNSAKAAMADLHGGEKQLTVPDILLHLVGHIDGVPENHDNDDPAPDDDYIVGGTGVVKALDICLNRAADGRKDSRDLSTLHSGTGTPKQVLQGSEVSTGKAREMSKNLLDSARKIRARLQPALIKEAKAGNDMSYRRLRFLDTTLEGMIERFENEYPETRLPKPAATIVEPLSDDNATTSSLIHPTPTYPTLEPASPDAEELDDNADPLIRPASVSRRNSSPGLASRQAQEEGRMHRLGQRVKRDILHPETEDYAHGTTGTESPVQHLQDLRRRLDAFEGREIKDTVERLGPETVFDMIGATAEELSAWQHGDPEGFERIKEARGHALALYGDQNGGTGFPTKDPSPPQPHKGEGTNAQEEVNGS